MLTSRPSGVLAASLKRSRDRWLSEGIFEKYWTKPTKKKNAPEIKNPPKDTMSKIGTCVLTIEPHIFDVTLFSVKEPIKEPPLPTQIPPQPIQRPILQYGPVSTPQRPPTGVAPPQQAPPRPVQQGPPQLPPNTPTHNPTFHTPPIQHPPRPQHQIPTNPPPSIPVAKTPPQPPRSSTVAHPAPSGPSPASQPPKPSADPVIQMLATKAATDADLRALMKIVASGKATPEQLKTFQERIDELNRQLQAQNARNAQKAAQPPQAAPAPGPPQPNAAYTGPPRAAQSNQYIPPRPAPHNTPHPPQPALHNQTFHNPSLKTEHYQVPPPQLRSKGPPPIRNDIRSVLIEFAGGSGDRFLLPKYSILDYSHMGQQVIVSFLIVRRGSDSSSGHYDPELDYYQPVTMRLAAPNPKVLEPLSRVVASQPEVRQYMDDIMDNATRAEYVHLAMQLPRDPDDIDEEEEAEEPRDDDLYSLMGSSRNTPLPESRKKVKKQAVREPFPEVMSQTNFIFSHSQTTGLPPNLPGLHLLIFRVRKTCLVGLVKVV
jgi:hypothetical protein